MRSITRLLAVAGALLMAVAVSMGHAVAWPPTSQHTSIASAGTIPAHWLPAQHMPAQHMPTLTLGGSSRRQAAAPEAAGPAAPLKDIRLPRVSTQGGTLRGPGYECTVLDQVVANPGQFGQATDHAIMGANFYCNTSGTTDLVYVSTLEVVCVKPDVYRTSTLESHDFISENFHCFRTANWRPPYDAHQYNGAGLPELTQADVTATRDENGTIIGDGYECVPAEFTFLGYGDTVFNGEPVPLVGADFACRGDADTKIFTIEQFSTLCVARNTFDMSNFEPLYVNSGKQYYCYVVRAEDLPPGDPTTVTPSATSQTPTGAATDVATPPTAAAAPGTEPMPRSLGDLVRTGANLWFLIFGAILLLILGLVLYTLRARSNDNDDDNTPNSSAAATTQSRPTHSRPRATSSSVPAATGTTPTRRSAPPTTPQPASSRPTTPKPTSTLPAASTSRKATPKTQPAGKTPKPQPQAATKPQPTRQTKPTSPPQSPPSRPQKPTE